jgi:hypothetical protein
VDGKPRTARALRDFCAAGEGRLFGEREVLEKAMRDGQALNSKTGAAS